MEHRAAPRCLARYLHQHHHWQPTLPGKAGVRSLRPRAVGARTAGNIGLCRAIEARKSALGHQGQAMVTASPVRSAKQETPLPDEPLAGSHGGHCTRASRCKAVRHAQVSSTPWTDCLGAKVGGRSPMDLVLTVASWLQGACQRPTVFDSPYI